MARKDVTDIMVLEAYNLRELKIDNRWPYEILAEQTGQPEKVCWRAMERAEGRGLIDCGVSLRSGWITDKGRELLLSDFMARSYEDKCVRVLEQAIKWKFPKIRGLEIAKGKGKNFSISFTEDGVHTENTINDFLNKELLKLHA